MFAYQLKFYIFISVVHLVVTFSGKCWKSKKEIEEHETNWKYSNGIESMVPNLGSRNAYRSKITFIETKTK